MKDTFSVDLQAQFIGLISKHTGLEIREQNKLELMKNLSLRTKALNLDLPDYYQLLNSQTKESQQEWEKVVSFLTNQESYFFRDLGQFILLRDHILPELIERRQKSKTLRLCSAGCSTGQEPYTLAIILKELLPDIAQWNVLILGVDINKKAIEMAQKAIYSSWSFRKVDEATQQQYFHKIGDDEYQLNPVIKNMVKFYSTNLVSEFLPNQKLDFYDLDLIICRNVFIYFHQETISQVVDKFYQSLRPLGHLLTGHAEIANNNDSLKNFQSKLYPASIIYQKASNYSELQTSQLVQNKNFMGSTTLIQKQTIKANNIKIKLKNNDSSLKIKVNNTPNQSISIEELMSPIKKLIKQKNYRLAIKNLEQLITQFPHHFQANYLMAEVQANLGKYEAAIDFCKRASTIDITALSPYYLAVQIAEEQGDLEEAKQLLKKIIYLEPNAINAYLTLLSIYQQEGDYIKAQKIQKSILGILNKLPDDQSLPELSNITVGNLILELTNQTT